MHLGCRRVYILVEGGHSNAFWTKDIAVYRENKDYAEGADLEVINDGIKATIELQEAAAANGEIYADAGSIRVGKEEVPRAGRPSMARNATDAFLMRTHWTVHEPTVHPGTRLSGTLPPELNVHGNEIGGTEHTTLFQKENKFGGLKGAGEALVDSDLIAT